MNSLKSSFSEYDPKKSTFAELSSICLKENTEWNAK